MLLEVSDASCLLSSISDSLAPGMRHRYAIRRIFLHVRTKFVLTKRARERALRLEIGCCGWIQLRVYFERDAGAAVSAREIKIFLMSADSQPTCSVSTRPFVWSRITNICG
ncbi:uncharacterized protein LOC103316057 isoform X2 [Nasonia vitripennis]|uniref:Uncharacterized protein n=1 Tax=Nasonia vitripennis TaxID=7425 RepID=A0A7M7QCW4_NASVI|nr:uncharacterized protein LOC103316057 isoform X2 [Nasonia vitripennis]